MECSLAFSLTQRVYGRVLLCGCHEASVKHRTDALITDCTRSTLLLPPCVFVMSQLTSFYSTDKYPHQGITVAMVIFNALSFNLYKGAVSHNITVLRVLI